MSFAYIHLSDIHFGQEKGGLIIVNDDVKEELILDVHRMITQLPKQIANGIIISGDIAYAGKQSEYEAAGNWLDRLTAAAGCDRTAVQIVPGNHDIDRDQISYAGQMIVDDIAKNGDTALDKYLASDQDREILYQKFSSYRTFAEAYDCPLDSDGNILNHRMVEIASNKYLRFHGVNTALLCSKNNNEEGNLLLGQRQRVLSTKANVEIIVIAHHPLHWLQDSKDALRYIKNRARVLISGHEHKPAHKIDEVKENTHLLSIASGATVPPQANEEFTFCYNILEFSWDSSLSKLCITIHPRLWNDEKKSFEEDTKHFNKNGCQFALKCPNFEVESESLKTAVDKKLESFIIPAADFVSHGKADQIDEQMLESQDQMLLLKFFRDLSSAQRLEALVRIEALPVDLNEPITHSIETKVVRSLLASGKGNELKEIINTILSNKVDNKDD